MDYNIAVGENDLVSISLGRCGCMYKVAVWNRSEHAMAMLEKFDSMTGATLRFFGICRKNGVEPRKLEWDASDFANID